MVVLPVPIAPSRRMIFFFQAEDGIRDHCVTGVQTCALPILPSFTGSVTVALGTNPGGSTLSGTTTVAAVNGVASFGDLSANKTGTSYALSATATGLNPATSSGFNITPGAAIQLVFGRSEERR